MGCSNTKSSKPPLPEDAGANPLSVDEIQDRIEAPPSSERVKIGDFSFRYAYISQRGFYPDDRDKANQDSYAVHSNFDGDPSKALLMVFDGHGKEGDLCAQFCRHNLPKHISAELKTAKNVEAGLKKSFIGNNEALHSDPGVDDSLSGTTAVGVLLHGRDMWVANVGDSRAIVCQEHEGRIVAKPLSCDQTPYRKDERERVKACGARVMSMDQIEGLEPVHENWGEVNLGEELDEGGDPPRIWSPFGEYPGTAFTRSMGDSIAEELGVFAEPEIIHRKIHAYDRFIVIASDGVFEFLTNQSVADMVTRYADPLDACRKVVQESYDLWLQYEVRTDDITIICMYLEDVGADVKGEETAPEADLDTLALGGLRPVRREMSRQRQRQFIMQNESFFVNPLNPLETAQLPAQKLKDDTYSIEDNKTPKTDTEKASILAAIKSNFLFEHVSDAQRQVLLDVMKKVPVKKGDWVIRQGDVGDRFYVIDEGEFEVHVNQEKDKVNDKEELGIQVHAYVPSSTIKPCFGHLALMYGKPRSATVIARTDGVLWALDRPVFRKILMKKSRREIAKVLRRVEVLHSLTLPQMQQLCDVMKEVEYKPGEYIIRQGEVGEEFYVIEEGTAAVSISVEGKEEPKEIRRLTEYNYFGERSLLLKEPRSANVTAVGNVRCLQISQHTFEEVLGPLQHIIDEDRKQRERRPGVPSMRELRLLGKVVTDDLGQMNLCKMPNSNATYTLRTMWKKTVSDLKQDAAVHKALDVLKHASESPALRMSCVSIPLLVGTYNETHAVHIVQQAAVVCSLSSLLEERNSLSMDCARHIAACVVLGLESLHKANILYRALSPELVCLDNRGCAVLMEYRLAKLGLETGFTVCGTPEYMAPEQVRNQGHGKAVDFWALGVLLYELVQGHSPFASDNEIDMYNKITSHRHGGLVYPTSFAPALCDFLDRLLHPDPAERLGSGRGADLSAVKTHQWFAGFDWGGAAKGEYFNQDLRQIAHEKIQKAVRMEGNLDPEQLGMEYSGETKGVWSRF
ncbi:unnamed protein product [Chrysoparadoxa australica]